MKRLSLILALALVALPAFGASWTVNTAAGQETRYTRRLTKENVSTCAAQFLSTGCTESAARTAFCQRTTGGAAPCAGSTAVRIYSTVGDFLDRFVLGDWLTLATAAQNQEDAASFLAAWAAQTAADRNAWCAAHGQANGCSPTP